MDEGEDRTQNDVEYNEGFRLFLTQMGAKKQHVKDAPLEEKTDNKELGNSIELVDPRSLYQLQLPKLSFARTVTNYKVSIKWLLEKNLILGRKFETYLGAKWKIAKWNRAKKWEMAKSEDQMHSMLERLKSLETEVRSKEKEDKERDLTWSDLNDDIVDCQDRLAAYDETFEWLIQNSKTHHETEYKKK